MLGPVLIRFGTEEQRTRYLPKILSGEHVWCQGYSEPNAGSDLAALRTEAVLDGDEFVVNGQKTWTTLAQDATHMFMLVRTDKTVKKQAGISFLLVDLATPGITVRPIRNIAGDEEFCEVFFDNVRVPRGEPRRRAESGLGHREGAARLRAHLRGQPQAFAIHAEAAHDACHGAWPLRRPGLRRPLRRAAAGRRRSQR